MYKMYFVYGTITLYCATFQKSSTIHFKSILQSYNPYVALTTQVWAVSRSLATTCEITFVLFSSAYLDVSVQRVCSPYCYGMISLQLTGLPHSEIQGYNGYLLLPLTYRSLSRPSSPLRA
jgi:hypothetical protein